MTVDKRAPESTGPAMYMLWPLSRPLPAIPPIPMAYSLFMVVSEDIDNARALVEIDGRLSDPGWSQFRDAVVPDGMFVIQERASSAWVGTISAVHNPAATRFYFPWRRRVGLPVSCAGASSSRAWRCADHRCPQTLAPRRVSPHFSRSAELAAPCDSSLSSSRVPAFHPCARVGPALGIRLRSLRRGTTQIRMAD